MSRRSFKLINKEFQIPFLLFFTSVFFLNLIVVEIIIFLCFKSFREGLIENGLSSDSVVFSFLKLFEANMQNYTFLIGLICLLITFFGGYYISHRIVGPIYRILKTLKKIQDSGDYAEVEVREKDFFKDLAKEITRALLVMNKGKEPRE